MRLLEYADFEVVAHAGDAEDLIRKVGAHRPDVAIVDIKMPPTHTDDGLRAALEIRRAYPETGVLVLSQYVEEVYAVELVEASPERVGDPRAPTVPCITLRQKATDSSVNDRATIPPASTRGPGAGPAGRPQSSDRKENP